MNISNNILKEHLKNVYFLCGGAYGGKTTMAKLLEKKYGFIRYREGDMWEEHFRIADSAYQPAISFNRSADWNGFYNQPVEQYHKWLTDGLREEAEMAIIDLIKLSQNKKVIADIIIPVDILKEIADYSQVVLLFAPIQMKSEHYFDRDDKQDMYKHILSMPAPQKTLENVLNTLTYKGEEEIQNFYDSGFKCIMRTNDSTIEKTVTEIEKHFNLI